jgi:hypothetical protein
MVAGTACPYFYKLAQGYADYQTLKTRIDDTMNEISSSTNS